MSCNTRQNDSQKRSKCETTSCKSKSQGEDRCAKQNDADNCAEADTRLRRSFDQVKDEKCGMSKKSSRGGGQEKDRLLNKLKEAEMDGQAAVKELCLLKEPKKKEKAQCCNKNDQVDKQKEKLLEKLDSFEQTNRCLSQLLKDQQCQEEKAQSLAEQKDALLKKLSACCARKSRLEERLSQREKEMETALTELASEKELAKTATEYTKFLECSKSQLTKQLKECEDENKRLCCQIKELEIKAAEHEEELSKAVKELEDLKTRGDRDFKDLKKAARAQKKRAEHCEECLEQLQTQMKDKDIQLQAALANVECWKVKVCKLESEKNAMEQEVICISIRVQELIEERQCIEEKARAERECLMEKLKKQAQENANIKQEFERIKSCVCTLEKNLCQAQEEVEQLKATICQYEAIVENYKCQVQKARQEAEELCMKLEMCNQEKDALRECMQREVEALQCKFKKRIQELEQLPEMLQSTECKLQESQKQLQDFEKKNGELSGMIAELRQRVKSWRSGGNSSTDLCQSSKRQDSCKDSCKDNSKDSCKKSSCNDWSNC